MIAITSISPNHPRNEYQHKAIASWIDLGFDVCSFNGKDEIEQLKDLYPDVVFIETQRTMELTYGKPYVAISAVLDWIKIHHHDYFCIINSDIELRTDAETITRIQSEMDNAIVMANRINYVVDGNNDAINLSGIDVFFIHRKYASMYPQSMFSFGQCFWDYEIPYVAIKNNVPVIFIEQRIAFHKNHKMQYSNKAWMKTLQYFTWHNGLPDTNTAANIYHLIYEKSIRKVI